MRGRLHPPLYPRLGASAAKPKMAATSFVVFVATPDGEIEQLNAATATARGDNGQCRGRDGGRGEGQLPLLVIYVRRWQRSQAAHAAFAFALVCNPAPLPFPSLPFLPLLPVLRCRMKTLGRKCLLCSGADKLRKIITLFVLVAINAATPPAHASAEGEGGVGLLCAAIKMPIIQLICRDERLQCEAWRASSLIFAICEKLLFMCLHPLTPLPRPLAHSLGCHCVGAHTTVCGRWSLVAN